MAAVWVAAGILLYWQARMVCTYLDVAGTFGLRGASTYSTPMGAAYPAFGADAQVWVRHAINLKEGDSLRLRSTKIDNAPEGREVHWNSAWAWVIAGSGYAHHLVSGKPYPLAVELAARWIGPVTMWLLMVLMSWWAARRGGLIAGLVVAAALTCKDRIYEGFFPSYVDHHGLLTLSVFGCILGLAFMGGGWWQSANEGDGPRILPENADATREAAIFSAMAGAMGMWVSAASVIVAIAVVGAAGLATVFIVRWIGSNQRATFDPAAWRLWGQVGATGSAFFYLVEYFPSHLGMRLEANHPLYSLAWLAGGEIIAQVGERWLGPKAERWNRLSRLVWPTALVALPALVILIWRAKVFVVSDPFLARLHSDYIQEFQPLWRSFGTMDAKTLWLMFFNDFLPALIGITALAAGWRRVPPTLWCVALVAGVLLGLGCLQSRWLLNGSAAQIPLVLVLIAGLLGLLRQRLHMVVAIALIAVVFIPSAALRFVGALSDTSERRVALRDANGMLFRDIADAIRKSQPKGPITMLASPNASTGIGYYGNFSTLGTLYWENNAGLKAAGSILAAKTEEEAAALIQKYGVTHIAMVAEENFIAQYYVLLHPGAKDEEVRKCFGHQLLFDKVIPTWLQILPYAVPEDLKVLKPHVMLFKVNFTQNATEALYHIAEAQIATGENDAAEKTLDRLISEAPHNHQPWLRKSELLLMRKNWVEGRRVGLEAAARMQGNERRQVVLNMAEHLYRGGQHRMAAEVYLDFLRNNNDGVVISYLTWILATSTDATLRDGATAVRLATELVKLEPTPLNQSIQAAALAETGRMGEAVQAIDRALDAARAAGDKPLLEVLEKRAALLRAGTPIRE
ncbi:MAG: hypothetical protein WCQ89_09660 [Verrucomicrobiota bacterium]